MRDYWEPMFPPVSRLPARKNSIEWVNLRLSEQVEAGGSLMADWYLLTDLDGLLKNLALLIQEKFGNESPSIAGLARSVQTRLKATKPPPDPSVAAAASAAAAVEGIKSESQAEELAGKISDFYIEQSGVSLIGHRLPRLMRWGGLENEPPNERGKTMLPPPRPNLRIELATLVAASSWKELLGRTREVFLEDACHFWFDVQRFADLALVGLGGEVDVLRMALLREFAGLLERLPTLPDLTYNDGTAFADEETRKWIDSTVKPSLASGSAPSGSGSMGIDEELEEHFSAARKLSRGGKLTDGLRLLQQGLEADGKARTRFLRRLEIAKILLQNDQPLLAVTMLDELASEVDRYRLGEWEKDLAVQVWSQQLAGLRRASALRSNFPGEDWASRIESVMNKISLVDIESALASA